MLRRQLDLFKSNTSSTNSLFFSWAPCMYSLRLSFLKVTKAGARKERGEGRQQGQAVRQAQDHVRHVPAHESGRIRLGQAQQGLEQVLL